MGQNLPEIPHIPYLQSEVFATVQHAVITAALLHLTTFIGRITAGV